MKKRETKPATPPAEESLGHGNHWFQRVEPNGAAVLADKIARCTVVVKNFGPAEVKISAYGAIMLLSAGEVRGTEAWGDVTVQNQYDEPALIAFDFVPSLKSR
ncbi:MAG: hypothetical protein ABSA68_14765 [Xanthobacteraceae bacterium]|jgi:hypothetical protein